MSLTRRRFSAVCTAFLGAAAAGRRTLAKDTNLPDCPSFRSEIVDWQVAAYDFGAWARPRQLRVTERGVLCGEPDGETVEYDCTKRVWKLKSYVSSLGLDNDLVVTVTNGGSARSEVRIPAADLTFSEAYKCYRVDPDITQAFTGDLDPSNNPGPLAIEARDGDRLLYRIEFATDGFLQAIGKALTEHGKLEAMAGRKECESPGCFLTTLCVGEIGLPDDCFELETLRDFRDGPLLAMPDGPAMIARYYEEAPRIVDALRRKGNEASLVPFYVTHILPTVLLVRLGFHRPAILVYRDMLRRLERRCLS